MKILLIFAFFLAKDSLTGVTAAPSPPQPSNSFSTYGNYISNSDSQQVDDDGNYIIGDMILSPEVYDINYNPEIKVGLNGLKDPTKRWTGGEGFKAVIPYDFKKSVREDDKKKVERALDRFNKEMRGCVNIRPIDQVIKIMC